MRNFLLAFERHRFFGLCATVFGLVLLTIVGCSKPPAAKETPENRTRPLNLIATTGQINSALLKLTAGTDAQIRLFCGPGVDPHSFSASTRDIQAMKDADAIIYNGFHLEARLDEHLHQSFKDKSWAMSSEFPDVLMLDWLEDGVVSTEAPYDPHIWNHLPGWMACVEGLAEHLKKIDPRHKAAYEENLAAYSGQLKETHQWALEQLAVIPQDRRFIVSAHDAFNYFAKVYDMQTLAVLGIGNDAEADIQTMSGVAQEISSKKIPVIFLEAITNPKVSQALKEACQARGWDVKIVAQQLYSDDLGETPPLDTFIGAFRYNVETMVENLK